MRKKSFAKLNKKVINPIRDGLTSTSLRILKVLLQQMVDTHNKILNSAEGNFKKTFFLPVNWVIEEMRTRLMVTEQINKIIVGYTYQKNTDFLESQQFNDLVDGIREYYDPHLNKFNQDSESDAFDEDVDYANYYSLGPIQQNTLWKARLTDFLLYSNEKWILDQYNLVKYFLIQNSIDGNIYEFYHPCYNAYNSIWRMKKSIIQNNSIYSAQKLDIKQVDNYLLNDNASENIDASEASFHENPRSYSMMSKENINIKKCDISALLKTMQEIENKMRMRNILEEGFDKLQQDKNFEEFDNESRTIKKQFSILNFGRNYQTLKVLNREEIR